MNTRTIFFNEKPIIISDQKKGLKGQEIFKLKKSEIKRCLLQLENNQIDRAFFYHKNVKTGFKKFKKGFKIIRAAGGLVMNSNAQSLWIFRNGKWDLPKGKIEKGEKKAAAAIREVEEECGIDSLVLKEKLTNTYHIYTLNSKYILKITYWYKMFSDYKGKLVPQTDEGISQVEWVRSKNIPSLLSNTYANIRLLF